MIRLKNILLEQEDKNIDPEIKRVIKYQKKGYKVVDKIDLPDGVYWPYGGGYEYDLWDINTAEDTGYVIITSYGLKGSYDHIRYGSKKDVKNGKPAGVSKILYKDTGYQVNDNTGIDLFLPPANAKNFKGKEIGAINKVGSSIGSIPNQLIESNSTRAVFNNGYFGGIVDDKWYLWDITSVEGYPDMSKYINTPGFMTAVKGDFYRSSVENINRFGIEDADETEGSLAIVFYTKIWHISCYKTNKGTLKVRYKKYATQLRG